MAVKLTEEFDDPQGRFLNYETEDLDLNDALAGRSHLDIRSFSNEIISRPTIMNDILDPMSDLNVSEMVNFELPQIGILEHWSVGTYGPDPSLAGIHTLRLDVGAETITTVSEGVALNLSAFSPTDTLSIAAPNFVSSNFDLTETSLTFTHGTDTVTLLFSDATITGNTEISWPLSALGNLTTFKPDVISFTFAGTTGQTVTLAALRILPPSWTPTRLGMNTQFQRLQPIVNRVGAIDTTPFPKIWRQGTEAPMPIDSKFGVSFYTGGGLTTSRSNSLTLFFRGRREDFLTQLDIDGITDQADLDSYGVQPDYGRAVYNPHPQVDYDTMQQTSLDTFTQFEMERQPDLISEAWIQVTLGWGDATGASRVEIATTETLATPIILTPTFTDNTHYYAVFEVVDDSIRVRIYSLDDFGKVGSIVFDSQEIRNDFLIHRRKGRFGWVADIQDGNSYINSIHSRGQMFNEVITQNFESYTPVEGTRLFAGATPDTKVPLGLEIFNGATVEVDFSKSRSTDGATKVTALIPSTGIQTELFDFDDFENTVINFDFYYPASSSLPEIYLYSDIGLFIPLRMPGLTADQWNAVSVTLQSASLEQTGNYHIVVAPVTGSTVFWIDNLVVTQRSVRWSGRATMQDPWGRYINEWTEFGSLVNDENNGVIFPIRDKYLQVRGQTLSQNSTIDKVYLKPKYAELGRIAPTGTPITTLDQPLSKHTVRLDVTPVAGTIGATADGNTYTWPGTNYHASNTSLTFTATPLAGSTPLDIIEYYWDFGDGVEATTTTPTTTHTYLYPNLTTIAHVRARNINGDEAWASLNLMLQ